jgi:hypothetical protein
MISEGIVGQDIRSTTEAQETGAEEEDEEKLAHGALRGQ